MNTKSSSGPVATLGAFLLSLWGAGAQPSLDIHSARGFPGQTATVPFQVRRATNLVAAQFDLAYHPAKGTLREPAWPARYSNHVVRSREMAPGVRRVLVYSRSNAELRTNGFSAAFGFSVPATERVGSGPITPQGVVLARGDGSGIVPVGARSGTVFVTPVYRDPVSGVVDLFLPAEADQRYLIQATTNFVRWENIGTNVASGDFLDLVDVDAPRYPYRFYRSALYDGLGEIEGVEFAANGQVTFRIHGLADRRYTVQASTNLVAWADVATLTATGGRVSFTNAPNPNIPARFFRLQSE